MSQLGWTLLEQKIYLNNYFSYNDMFKISIQINELLSNWAISLPANKFQLPQPSTKISDIVKDIKRLNIEIINWLEDTEYKVTNSSDNEEFFMKLCMYLTYKTGVYIDFERFSKQVQ